MARNVKNHRPVREAESLPITCTSNSFTAEMTPLESSTPKSGLLDSERGASHFIGMILLLTSIYSTILMFQQGFESNQLAQTVVQQKKKIDMMELKLQVLELRVRP